MSAWTVIAHTEVGSGGTKEIVFSSIPNTYTDLLVTVSGRSNVNAASGGNVLLLGFNTSYSNINSRILEGNGSTASSSTDNFIYVTCAANDYTSNTFGNTSIYIPNYTSTNSKSVSLDGVAENNATASRLGIYAGLWSVSPAVAITGLTIKPINAPTGDILQYSSATLYGITKGSSGGVTVS